MARPILIAVGLCCLPLLVAPIGCRDATRLTDARNPFYVKGVKLRQQGDYGAARAAFEQCLRLSPECVDAHLQVGMLCEDHLDDPLTALFHYRQYLDQAADRANAAIARRSFVRCQQAYQKILAEHYPPARQEPQTASPSDPGNALQVERLTDQKTRLLSRLRDMNAQLIALRQDLAKCRARNTPGQLPTEQADPPLPDVKTYTVKTGDTLSKLAREFYGSATHWPALHQYNRGVIGHDPVLIPGTLLSLPPLDDLETPEP